jgi:hypothetical protein
LDSIRENRTGYTKAAEGMKSGSLATETLGELQMQQSQSSIRLEMIARTIAETGMRDLFRIVHALTLKHSTKAEKIRLRNQWVTVNPREWVRRTDLAISVGLGSTTGPQQMQNLMLIGQAQQQAMPLGIVTPENIYNTVSKLATAAGFKNPGEFFTKPQPGQQPPQNKDPLVQAQEVKTQGETQIAQMKQQGEIQKFHAEQQAKPAELQMELQAAHADGQIKLQIAREQAEINARVEIEKAQILAAVQERVELFKANLQAQTAREVAKNQPERVQ